jgi:signal transduction histidine kinase
VFVLPVVLGVVEMVAAVLASRPPTDHRGLDPVGVFLVAAGPAALVLKRRRPVAALILSAAATAAYLLLGYAPGLVVIAPLVALTQTIKTGHRTAGWLVAVLGFGGFAVAATAVGREPRVEPGALVAAAAWILVALVLSEATRIGRERGAELSRRMAEADRRRVSEERLRIARELHDVLAHHISLINVQAGVALHLMDERTAEAPAGTSAGEPEQVRAALAAIKLASKDALVELRSTLGVLRQVDEAAPRQPAPTLDRLDELVAGARAAGPDVRTEVAGTPTPLPPRVDLAGYRIVQEALTNVSRHAGPAAVVTVRLEHAADALVVRVDDDGGDHATSRAETDPVPGGGNGIPGMRERATALGGTFAAGPTDGGGWRVEARLPLGAGR